MDSADISSYFCCRHAVDFRLMTNQRVAILDASHSLFKPSNVRIDGASKKDKDKDDPNSKPLPSTSMSASASTVLTSTSNNNPIGGVFLQPIPEFAVIMKQVVAEVSNTLERGSSSKNLVDLNHGLICDTTTVGVSMQDVHRRVVENLKAVSKS